MTNEFRVIHESTLNGKQVVTLDKSRSFDEFNTKKIVVGGKEYDYSLTHDDSLIIIDTTDSLIDKIFHFA